MSGKLNAPALQNEAITSLPRHRSLSTHPSCCNSLPTPHASSILHCLYTGPPHPSHNPSLSTTANHLHSPLLPCFSTISHWCVHFVLFPSCWGLTSSAWCRGLSELTPQHCGWSNKRSHAGTRFGLAWCFGNEACLSRSASCPAKQAHTYSHQLINYPASKPHLKAVQDQAEFCVTT